LANLPLASLHRVGCAMGAAAHFMNLPFASRHWAASAEKPTPDMRTAIAEATMMERMVISIWEPKVSTFTIENPS